jgi:hypothetical protein
MHRLLIVILVLVAVVTAAIWPLCAGATSVSAHVHAVTPLNDCSVDNAEH